MGLFAQSDVPLSRAVRDARTAAAQARRDKGDIEGADMLQVMEDMQEAHSQMMQLPPLRDLIAAAEQQAPNLKQMGNLIEQEKEKLKISKLRAWDVGVLQGSYIIGRGDIFSLNTDGGVIVPSASVIDNVNLQGIVGLRISPSMILQNRRQAEINRLEIERLSMISEENAQTVAAQVVDLYNLTQAALDELDVRAEVYQAVMARTELAEGLFRQGSMTLQEYAEIEARTAEAASRFFAAKGQFSRYFQALMVRVYGKRP